MSLRRYFVLGAASGVTNVVVSAATVAIALPLLVAGLGLRDYGLWATLGVFVNLAIALDLGLARAIVYVAAREDTRIDDLLSAGLATSGVCAGIAGIVLTLVAPDLWPDATSRGLLVPAGVSILGASLLTSVLRGVLEARRQISLVNWGFMLQTLFYYGVAVACVRLHAPIGTLLVASAIVYLVLLAAHAAAVVSVAGVGAGRVRLQNVKVLLTRALPIFAVGAPPLLLIPALQFWFLHTTTDPAQYGAFDVALRIAMLATTAVASLSAPLYAVIATLRPDDRTTMLRLVASHLRITVPVFALGAGTFAVLGAPLIEWVLGAEAAVVFEPALILIVGAGSLAALEPITRACMGTGRLQALLWIRILIVVVALLSAWALILGPVLLRFSAAYALGCLGGAIATACVLWHWHRRVVPTRVASVAQESLQ